MTMITPEQEIATSEEHFKALQTAIRDLRREIMSLKEQANSGEEINETAASKALAKASGMVATCVKVENYLSECRNKQAGIARGGYALDLDRARADIGCKLDRLRRCGAARPVFE
jgi:cell division septum initiation protein DivIVA